MAHHVVVGAGPVGGGLARQLARAGHTVLVITRSGRGPDGPGIERLAADTTDPAALTRAAAGAAALYNAANPPYGRWATHWPPIADALLHAAEATGAVLVTMSNLYGYGPVAGPMTPDTALAATSVKGRVRAQMWRDALAAHESGRIRACEARAADFIGPGVVDASFGERVVPRVLAGRSVRVLGDPDQPHAVAFLPDVVRVLEALGTDERAWGRAWHVPSAPAVSARALVEGLAAAADVAPVKVTGTSARTVRLLAVAMPALRPLPEVLYQFDRPFLVDAGATTSTFGIDATPLDTALKATVAWWRAREPALAG